jgi:hypothetical protein
MTCTARKVGQASATWEYSLIRPLVSVNCLRVALATGSPASAGAGVHLGSRGTSRPKEVGDGIGDAFDTNGGRIDDQVGYLRAGSACLGYQMLTTRRRIFRPGRWHQG